MLSDIAQLCRSMICLARSYRVKLPSVACRVILERTEWMSVSSAGVIGLSIGVGACVFGAVSSACFMS